jgi:hypothetical protein
VKGGDPNTAVFSFYGVSMDAAITAALGGAAVALIIGIRSYILKILDIKMKSLEGLDAQGQPLQKKERTYDALLRRGDFYRNLEAIRELKSVHRVLLLVGANCGGVPTPSKAYRVIARYGWAEKTHPDPMAFYNFELVIDSHYCDMLADMIRHGFVLINTESMPDSILKTYYIAEKVHQSYIFFLNIDPDNNEMMFVSVASYGVPITTEDVLLLRMRIYRMRAALAPTGNHDAIPL